MSEKKQPWWISGAWLGLILLAGVLAVFWIMPVVNEHRAVLVAERFVEAVESGDHERVFAVLDEYDPEWSGTAGDWTGVDGDTRSVHVWILEEWRKHPSPEGSYLLFERWLSKDPSYSRDELRKQLRWLKDREEGEHFRKLFLSMVAGELKMRADDLGEHPLSWIDVAGNDSDLLLATWQMHRESGATLRLPDFLISTVVSPESLAEPGSLEQILRLTGLLDPVASFQLLDSPWQPVSYSGRTWIEWFYYQYVSSHQSGHYQIETLLKEKFSPTVGPEALGLFLLKCLSSSSDETGHSEIFAADLAAIAPHLEALPNSSKPAMAEFLSRYLVSFDGNQVLREWVWANYFAKWENRGREILSHPQGPPGQHKRILNAWLWDAVKSGHAEEVSPVIHELWKEQLDQYVAEGASMQENGLKSKHPYQLARSTQRSAKEGLFDASGFDLLLAVARDPATPPSMKLPDASAMVVRNLKSRSPWKDRPLEEALDMLNDLGEKYVDNPLRFLIVASFHAEEISFNEVENLARFQIAAERNEAVGGWLARDLADLLPSQFSGSASRDRLLAAGGRLPSFECVNRYLADDRAPVAARLSFAMAVLPPNWGDLYFPEQYPHLPSDPEGEVDLAPLALAFASAVSADQWPTESIHMYFWQQVIDRWIDSTVGCRTKIGDENRAEARRLLRVHFEALAQREVSALTGALPAADSKEMKRVFCVWTLYASLLRADGDGEALVRFRSQLPVFPDNDNPVFRWIPSSVVRWGRSDARLASETYLSRFRREGKQAIRAEDVSAPGEETRGIQVMTEVCAALKMREWMDFCSGVLDQIDRSDARSQMESAAFYALPPKTGWGVKDKKETEARVKSLLSTASRLPGTSGHSEFFSLALLPVVRANLKEAETAESFLKKLESETSLVIAPDIRAGLSSAAEAIVSTRYGRYLETLRNAKIPLAQRWLAANYLLNSRFGLKLSWPEGGEAWETADRGLVEVALDLLIEAVDLKLPVWEIVDRGLGQFDEKSYHRSGALTAFQYLHRKDPVGQRERIRDLLRPDRVEFLLLGRQDSASVHPSLYRLAVDTGDHETAASLFSRIREKLVFSQQVNWLVRANDWHGLADLLTVDWPKLDRFGASDFMEISDSALNEVTTLLPEEELRFLVRLFFRPRMRKDSLLDSAMEGGSDRLREVGREFLDRDFVSAGIERLCLEQLPMRIGEFPDLDAWLESRRGDRTFSDFLESDEETFLSEWPYWSKRIEVLMDTGNFEAIGEMLPGSDWFAGKNRDHPSPSWAGPNTREEILWMGFARSVGPILYFGSRQARRDAAEVVSKLLQSPPLLHEKRTPKSLYGTAAKWNHTVWTFRVASVQELSDLGLAALLAASLEDSEEMALQECETISLFRRPMVVGEERIHAESGQHFLAVVLGIAQTLDEESKEKLLLRAFKTAPFQPSVVGRHEFPCHTLSRRVRPPELSIPFLEEMAKLRLAQSPEDPVLIGDYGLMLIGGNKVEEATPILERALQLLPALDQENLVNEIAETLVDLKRRK